MAKNINHHHHRHSHQRAPRRASTALILQSTKNSDLISAEALQHVVLPKKKKSPSKSSKTVKERQDPVGDHMTRLLNAHPDFCYDPQRTAAATSTSSRDDGKEFTLSPILCRQNWMYLRRHVRRLLSSLRSPPTLALSIIGFCCEQSPSRPKVHEHLKSTMLLLLTLLALGLSVISITTHSSTLWIGREALLLLLQLLWILVDWEELEKNLPLFIRGSTRQLSKVVTSIDRYIFMGKRYAGREWNSTDFEFDSPMSAQSRHSTLWEVPPPCIKEAGQKLCLDPRYMARENWGQDTSRHVVAINFCYVMMREEHVRKRARRSTMFHQQPLVSEQFDGQESSSSLNGPRSNNNKQDEVDDVPNNTRVRTLPTKHNATTLDCNIADMTSYGGSDAEGIELVHDGEESTTPEYLGNQLTTFATMLEDDNDGSGGMLLETPMHDKYDDDENASVGSSVGSCSSAAVAEMNWMDLSAKIGMRVLNSAHLQRVVASQEAAERLKNITEQFVVSPNEHARGQRKKPFDFASNVSNTFGSPLEVSNTEINSAAQMSQLSHPRSPCRPMHSMWTSAAAAGVNSDGEHSDGSESDAERNDNGKANEIPSTPPKIIRTTYQNSESFHRKNRDKRASPVSPLRDVEASSRKQKRRHPPMAKHKALNRVILDDSETCELVCEPSETYYEEQTHELIDTDSSHDEFDQAMAPKIRRRSQSAEVYPAKKKAYRRAPLSSGVKVAAPMFPLQPPGRRKFGHSTYQMATVVSSTRIWVAANSTGRTGHTSRDALDEDGTNCLSVTCKIDKSFLRNGDFTELTFRVMDEWSPRYMPKHSKVPIGSCVATSFGVGVVVGWRVEDDCHVIRSLWQRRGPGAAHAYLTRDAIRCVLEAAIGFDVETKLGSAKVLGYVDAGTDFQNGRYIIELQGEGVYKNCVVALKRSDVYSCHGAQFMPIIEHIKEACHFQIMLDSYKALVRQQKFSAEEKKRADDHLWKFWSENLEVLWQSFLKATSEDREFDEGVDSFMGSIIDFLERLDRPPSTKNSSLLHDPCDVSVSTSIASFQSDTSTAAHSAIGRSGSEGRDEENVAGFWILNDILGGVFQTQKEGKAKSDASVVVEDHQSIDARSKNEDRLVVAEQGKSSDKYKRAFAVVRTLMKTVSLARAASVGRPQFRLAMTICREFLMFVRTLIKVQQKNVSKESLRVWRNALEEIVSFFGPIKERLEKIGRGIAQRMEQQGRKAKIKVLRFADSILLDELFLSAATQGEWDQCLVRIESSMIKAKIIDEASCVHYRKTARFLYEHLVLFSSKEGSAAARNNEKLAHLAKLVQFFASPKRSILKVLYSDDVLEILERILVRVFYREEIASRTLTIHASNFKSLRHLRLLKDMSVAGKLWIPLLDAADEEFSYVVSKMPENAKEFMCPLSSIFSLCVAQFHKINAGNSTADWLDFLLEEDGVRIIHDIDMNLILALSSFSRDVKEMMEVLPYYPSIDDDILNLLDEVKIDMFLKEASEAIDDADKLACFIRDKASMAIERFVTYLPKLSIPVERRELGDGWVLTCHGENGNDLTLSDVKMKRKNLICQVLGGDSLFLPLFDAFDDGDKSVAGSVGSFPEEQDEIEHIEHSILDDIKDMILQAQRYGSWTVGIGGVGHRPTDPYMNALLHGLPITSVLNCAIDLYRNLELDDDELLEIAIKDVSYQIQLHKEIEDRAKEEEKGRAESQQDGFYLSKSSQTATHSSASGSGSFEDTRNRFNPRVDPTVLFLEIKNLTLHLEQFRFRIEKNEKRTVFDPVFEGCGTVLIEDVSILFRVECASERRVGHGGSEILTPVLLLQELEVDIKNVRLKVQDTGADWLLNKAVKGFAEQITQVVAANLKEQIQEQTKSAIEQLNTYFLVNPDILLNILGITMDDLEEISWCGIDAMKK